MLIQVKLLQYASKIFTYSVPDHLIEQVIPGSLVRVPLKKKIVPALVAGIELGQKKYAFKIKAIDSIYQLPSDPYYLLFLQKIAKFYQIDSCLLLQRIQHFLEQKENDQLHIIKQNVQVPAQVILTHEQQHVIDAIKPSIDQGQHQTFVLHGVTGSGKTEVYKNLISHVLAQKKSVIVMFPEVSLALRFETIFRAYFQETPILSFHCATSIPQKKALWNALLQQQPIIVIGIHLPVLLPIANLGLIVVDEEHDHGYQEKKHPKLHSRDMAILKANLYQTPIVLGSATPSVQTLYNVEQRGWKKLQMLSRYAGKFPQIQLVSLKQRGRKHFWFSDELIAAITDRLESGQQTIIFLNRRGFSFFVQCPCSFVFMCHQCSVSLTLHAGSMLLCHYCGHEEQLPSVCSACQGKSDEFLRKGIGTQQVVALLLKIFPMARIERADMDSTKKKRSWANTVQLMQDQQIDILVGTQSITKGYHFPGVTLVGVLWADLNLHFPMYNAAEVCLQQLIQVAGRAGRQSDQSLVIVQAFDTHPIFGFLNEIQYQKFYEYEIQKRTEVGYPPIKHIAEIELKGTDTLALAQQAQQICTLLKKIGAAHQVEVLGPIQAIVHMIKNVHSQKIYAKSLSRNTLINIFAQLPESMRNFNVNFTIDPVG
jgi:primosomal protein N' (replication factor Y)